MKHFKSYWSLSLWFLNLACLVPKASSASNNSHVCIILCKILTFRGRILKMCLNLLDVISHGGGGPQRPPPHHFCDCSGTVIARTLNFFWLFLKPSWANAETKIYWIFFLYPPPGLEKIKLSRILVIFLMNCLNLRGCSLPSIPLCACTYFIIYAI